MRSQVFAGLFVGIGLTFISLSWFFEASNHIVFETDETKTLGLQFEPSPQAALRSLSLEEISKKLGFEDPARAMNEAGVLSERVIGGYLPNDWDTRCAENYSPNLCSTIADYFGNQGSVFPALPKHKHSYVPFDIKKIKALEQEDYNALVSRAPDWTSSQIQKFAAAVAKVDSCPKNFSLVLLRKMEPFLDSEAQWKLYNEIQERALSCVTSQDAWAEFVYDRAAYFYMAHNQDDKALGWLEKAMQVDQKKEEYRTLYWLYKIQKKQNKTAELEKTKERLFSKYPISWHCILAKVEEGVDPLEYFRKNPVYSDRYETNDPVLDKRIYWLQVLMMREDSIYAVKKYGEFVVRSLGNQTEPGVIQYLARSFDRWGFYRLQIIALNQLNLNRPEFLTRESLRLLYPKPFIEEMNSQSPHLDTALLLGLARQESSFDPGATSKANARGLLQILPSTARGIKKIKQSELYDYAHNIEIGSQYVLKLIDQFDGSVERALASYNAGQGMVRKWESRYKFVQDPMIFLEVIPFRETRDYVPSILRNAYWYHRLFPEFTQVLTNNVTTSALLRAQLTQLPVKAQDKSPAGN